MASTSTPYSQAAPVVLPSIHEMFPEHIMPRAAASAASARPRAAPATPSSTGAFPRSHFVPPPPPLVPYPSFSFDVLKSDPRGSSLEHIASSRPQGPARRRPAVQTQPPEYMNSQSIDSDLTRRAQSASASSDGDTEMEDMEEGDGEGGAEEEKKHVCPTCAKRFNRPSSLRIHVNTHTGATPFRCPHPSCGRAFNVNSNMRRHYRNHGSPSLANSPTSSNNPYNPNSTSYSASNNVNPNNHPYPASYSSPTSPTLYSPTSPPSASWSMSSGPPSSFASPVTPMSASSPFGAGFARGGPAFWGDAHAAKYSESDVRSERRR